ncbi:MAG: ATP-binding protein [Sorangiineae bacterium PRO1]|nr:ATP-binding protein [Sorangiineae bacterium PRO1]
MSRLVGEVTAAVEERIRTYARSLRDGDAELRSVFHGPPVPYLRAVLKQFADRGGIEVVLQNGESVVCPVLLPLDGEAGSLSVGATGECSRDFLVSLRNTPNGKRWVALMAPGSHDARSVTGATDEFGISALNNGGTATVDQWLHDPFVAGLLDRAVERLQLGGEGEIRSARVLAERAIHAAAEAEHHDPSRKDAWALLSRLFSVGGSDESVQSQWSRACGVPLCGDGRLDHETQQGVLDEIAALIATGGFGACADRLRESATDSEQQAVDGMIAHLREGARIPPAVENAPEHYFAPSRGTEVEPAPSWWTTLTAERLREMLGNEAPRPETLLIEVLNPLFPPAAGLPTVVRDVPRFRLGLPDGTSGPVDVSVSRLASRVAAAQWTRRVPQAEPLSDGDVPAHATPLRYVVSADGFKQAAARVVVLDQFAPGVVITSRTASKVSLPKQTKVRGKYECQMVLSGEGRHFLDLHVAAGASLGDRVVGGDSTTDADDALVGTLAPPPEDSAGPWGLEIVATPECHYDIPVSSPSGDYSLRLLVSCGEAGTEGCRSEFERLIRLNRTGLTGKGTFEVQIDRQVRLTNLQSWALEKPDESFYPLVLASDCRDDWREPLWSSMPGSVLSTGQFIHDPRPRPDEFSPPEEFVTARRDLAARIRGGDGHGVVEAAELGMWMTREDFAEVVDRYVRTYRSWLESDPDIASWVDVVAMVNLEADGSLVQEPFAVLLTPLHPLRMGWHALAQKALLESSRSASPCPAASILDPDCVPDAFSLPLRTASGEVERLLYLSAESSSDYWSVLWAESQLSSVNARAAAPPFDREFGLRIGGVASGFSAAQVQRALTDVELMFAAKPHLNVLVSSATASGSACNEGIMQWARDHFSAASGPAQGLPRMGTRILQVFDERRSSARPEDAEIANLAEDTGGAVRWFDGRPGDAVPDLGIIAQLEASNAAAKPTGVASPIGRGALLRHRVRTQLQAGGGAFISESRMGSAGPPTGDALADHLSALAAKIENLADRRLGYVFAPSVKTIQSVLIEKAAEYAAVSSSAVDPACFLGGWLEGAYLWDYDLPSYSNRPGDSSGYYLLSRVRRMDADAIRGVLKRLPDCEAMSDDEIQQVLLEVARRGIPTVRGLSAGHSGASGDLGLFLAGRLLQDAFRLDPRQDGLFPLINAAGEDAEVVLAIPVDPFRGYLADLQKALGQSSMQRPDIVIFGISITPSRVVMRVTPVEVKWRQHVLSVQSANEALSQARNLSVLVSKLHAKSEEPGSTLWRLACQHLLISMLDFGFRVYSQREVVRRDPEVWTRLHQQSIAAILGETAALEVDSAGRLIIFDSTEHSTHQDLDGDGLKETVVVSPKDAAALVLDRATAFVGNVQGALGDWQMLPQAVPRVPRAAARVSEVATRPFGEDQRQPATGAHQGVPERLTEPQSTGGDDADASVAAHGSATHTSEPVIAADQSAPEAIRPAPTTVPPVDEPVRKDATRGLVVQVGRAVDGFTGEARSYLPSVTDLNQLNIGVVGDLGTGKTQLIKSLVYQITNGAAQNGGVRPRFLIFDYKRDYESADFVNATGAKVVKPYQLPINLFDTSGVERVPQWLPRFQFFADVLDKIYSNIGPVQRSHLQKAVKAAHEAAAAHGRAATIYDVQGQYEVTVGGRQDSVLSILNELTIGELFTREPAAGASFDSFFDGVVVISLSSLGSDDRAKNLVVATFLNLFYEFMLRLPKRPFRGQAPQLRTVDSYLLVDEADHIMKYEFDVLKSILLQGREFGVGVLLASQFLRHFKVGATNYREPLLTWFIHKVPDLRPQELGDLGMTANLPQLAERIKQLPMHHCLYKTFDVPGSVIEGLPFYRLRETQAGTPK